MLGNMGGNGNRPSYCEEKFWRTILKCSGRLPLPRPAPRISTLRHHLQKVSQPIKKMERSAHSSVSPRVEQKQPGLPQREAALTQQGLLESLRRSQGTAQQRCQEGQKRTEKRQTWWPLSVRKDGCGLGEWGRPFTDGHTGSGRVLELGQFPNPRILSSTYWAGEPWVLALGKPEVPDERGNFTECLWKLVPTVAELRTTGHPDLPHPNARSPEGSDSGVHRLCPTVQPRTLPSPGRRNAHLAPGAQDQHPAPAPVGPARASLTASCLLASSSAVSLGFALTVFVNHEGCQSG
ncbi:uncharacterized protein LOC124078750 [Marmota monax]|uniref:uncharacterized protein LOC124078750 n=1 Tax=Marmota monax TaxID=9995 RepID=UPI0026EC580F|nr:uncharacterized protein LOC124078750 [Marmota monax]